MLFDIQFTGIVPHKDEIKKIFNKHKEALLVSIDKELKSLGFNKKG